RDRTRPRTRLPRCAWRHQHRADRTWRPPMSTYRIYLTQTASCSVEVEADDFEEATEKAYDLVPSGLCAHCSGWGQSVGIDLGGGWEVDEDGYWVDGEFVDVAKASRGLA